MLKKLSLLSLSILTLTACGGQFDEFAKCLNDSGAVLYTTTTCPHCKNQKELFGESVYLLNQVVCDLNDDNKKICSEQNITGVPTWTFADGTRLSGEQSLEKLSQKTSCVLNQ